jgi:hypothetical protein
MIAAFIITLTIIGFVTIPVEVKELGKKITIYIIGIIMEKMIITRDLNINL